MEFHQAFLPQYAFWNGMARVVSSRSHETIDMDTGLLSYYQRKVWEKEKS